MVKTTSDKTVSQILSDAAELGKHIGIAKYTYHVAEDSHYKDRYKLGSMCVNGLIGAVINEAAITEQNAYEAMINSPLFNEVAEFVVPLIPHNSFVQPWQNLATWNNEYVTRPFQVIDVLEKAAAAAKVLEPA